VEIMRGAALVPISLIDGWRIVSKRRPHVVIGVGGYSSGALVLLASLRGVPTLLLEQNAMPGLTNRLLAPFASAVAVTFESTREVFGAKAFLSGNPVRPEFLSPVEPPTGADGTTRVLVFGGSQGSHAINMAMIDAAPQLAARPELRLTHQTGVTDLEMVRLAYRRVGLEAEIAPFFDDLGRRLGLADLIVCRAGATTVAELTAAGKPALLVPLPSATDDHQRKNAEALAASGAAEVLPQAELTGQTLAARIVGLVDDPARRLQMASAARALARPQAARVIVDRALELIAGRKGGAGRAGGERLQ
jgi:UDP-N-acetylglucosamine--N-acetylmuramyl-(pentapeptide) pyrophosphoryl-undecaprenol N-acetylglucosamine transferase